MLLAHESLVTWVMRMHYLGSFVQDTAEHIGKSPSAIVPLLGCVAYNTKL